MKQTIVIFNIRWILTEGGGGGPHPGWGGPGGGGGGGKMPNGDFPGSWKPKKKILNQIS